MPRRRSSPPRTRSLLTILSLTLSVGDENRRCDETGALPPSPSSPLSGVSLAVAISLTLSLFVTVCHFVRRRLLIRLSLPLLLCLPLSSRLRAIFFTSPASPSPSPPAPSSVSRSPAQSSDDTSFYLSLSLLLSAAARVSSATPVSTATPVSAAVAASLTSDDTSFCPSLQVCCLVRVPTTSSGYSRRGYMQWAECSP
ncbi:hypothetical protein ACLOJK_039095 [Asimina triloba]